MTTRSGATPEPRHTGHDPFPWVVSLGCVSLGIALFLHSTMPALAERQALDRHLLERSEGSSAAERTAAKLRERRYRLTDDPESLLVEFDRQGYLPDRAVERFQRAKPAPTVATSGRPIPDLPPRE